MRIALDVTSCAKSERRGIAYYGWALAPALVRTAPEHEFDLAVRPNRWYRRHLVREMLPGHKLRLCVDGFAWLTMRGVDVVHGIGIHLPSSGRFGRVVTVHDLNVFEFPELSTEAWRQTRSERIRKTVERADLIVAPSEQGARSMGEHLGVPRDQIRVVPHGVDLERFARPADAAIEEIVARLGLGPGPFVLALGRYGSRKNQAGLLEAFARASLPPEWQVVLVGPREGELDALRPQLSALGLDLDERVKTVSWIEDEDLPALIASAAIFACPSMHEGFGMPVLEAQAVGTPVISSNRGALPETVGDVGLVFDPDDMEDFAGAIVRMANDEALRQRCRQQGPERTRADYSWDRVAQRMLDVYAEVGP